MIGFAVRRLAAAVATAWVASLLAFFLFWTVPNVDPSYFLGGAEHGNDFTRERAKEKYGLNDPLPTQYLQLMGGILSGDVECFYGCANLRTAFLQALPEARSFSRRGEWPPDVGDADLVVNATAARDEVLVELSAGQTLVDLPYPDSATAAAAKEAGATVYDGLDVLVAQGAASLELWTGLPAPVEVMRAAVHE